MRRSTAIHQGHVRRLSKAEHDAAMRRLYQPLPPDPRTPAEIAAAQAAADLAEASRWGYRADEPESLNLAIRALDSASVVRRDPYSDSTCRGDELRAQVAGDLARRLRSLLDRTVQQTNSEQP